MHISDDERRRRLVARHHHGATASGVEQAVRDLVALHSSDPTSPHLSLWARVPGYRPAALDDALVGRRTLWRLHAMRRTLWVAAADEAPVLEGAAGRKVAAAERARLLRLLAAEDDVDDPAAVLDGLAARVLDALADGTEASTRALATTVEGFDRPVTLGSGRWAQRSPLGPRVLQLLAMQLAIVRGGGAGSWRASQYAWARTGAWFPGGAPEPLEVPDARARLAARYLTRFGPATSEDLRWWAGWTKGDTARALAACAAVEVRLDGGRRGWLAPGDEDAVAGPPAVGPVVALLPSLDPSTMGWRERDFHLDPAHVPSLFDANGNAGPTVWVDGRVVGGWAARGSGDDVEVATALLSDVGREVADLVAAAAARLAADLDEAWTPRFPTPIDRRLRGA